MVSSVHEWGSLRDDATTSARMDYDAAGDGKGRRRVPGGRIVREEVVLPQRKREVVTSGVRDLKRNLSILDWAARKHLDYNTQFNLQSSSGDEAFDLDFEAWVDEISLPKNCDVAGRYGFDSMLRMVEACAVLEGDCGTLKLESGHIQGIESDRIRNPEKAEGRWFNGVKVDEVNRALAYGIHRRGDGGKGYEFDRIVPASNLYLHGYFSRFDQCRGVSPLTSAANDFQDFYEGKDLLLAKMKVQSFFAVAFFREAMDAAGQVDETEAVDEDGNETNRGGYKIDFGKGPALLDLDEGDKAEFLEGSTPANSTQDFLMLVCQIGLKALDLPFSFFDESFTNFFGSRAAWLHYERSCFEKRNNLIRFANDWLSWQVARAIKAKRLRPTRKILQDSSFLLRPWWEFVPVGMPWWDPGKEIDGDVKAIEEGLSSRQRVCRQRGTDFYENVRQRAREEEFAKKMNVKLGSSKTLAPGAPKAAPADDESEDEDVEKDGTEDEDEDEDETGDDE